MPVLAQLIEREEFRDENPGFMGDVHGILSAQFGLPYAHSVTNSMSPMGIPCLAPPWGTVSGVDVVSGKLVWQHPAGTGLSFHSGTQDYYLRAYDTESGKMLWKGRLPSGSQSTPMTYIGKDGRQYRSDRRRCALQSERLGRLHRRLCASRAAAMTPFPFAFPGRMGSILPAARSGQTHEMKRPAKIEGGCHCGAIRYNNDADPVMVVNCYCEDCRKISGGIHSFNLVMPAGAVMRTGGEVASYVDRTGAGRPMTRRRG